MAVRLGCGERRRPKPNPLSMQNQGDIMCLHPMLYGLGRWPADLEETLNRAEPGISYYIEIKF